MRLTPLDIQQKQFRRRYKGYDLEEINVFLDLVSEEFEELRKENTHLKEKAAIIENQLQEYERLEVALRDTLIKTQEFVETYKANAIKDAEHLQKEAELRAEEVLHDVQQRVANIHKDITKLKGIRNHFKEEMKKLIENSLRKL